VGGIATKNEKLKIQNAKWGGNATRRRGGAEEDGGREDK
jgi:hypothetical protein